MLVTKQVKSPLAFADSCPFDQIRVYSNQLDREQMLRQVIA